MTRDDMPAEALESCAAALRCDVDDVIELRDGADLTHALLACLVLELRRKHQDNGDDQAQMFCSAVLAGWGETPFTARQLLTWCETGLTREQRAAMAACRSLCGMSTSGSCDLSTVQLGVAFKRAAVDTENAQLRLESAGSAKNVTIWQVRGLRG